MTAVASRISVRVERQREIEPDRDRCARHEVDRRRPGLRSFDAADPVRAHADTARDLAAAQTCRLTGSDELFCGTEPEEATASLSARGDRVPNRHGPSMTDADWLELTCGLRTPSPSARLALPTTFRSRSIRLPTTFRPCSIRLPTTFRPCSIPLTGKRDIKGLLS
ncbi:MAG TPA: hypothetical protein VKR30_07955 [Candidatus Limnocylindrales bacterium]|nr:hypothetical protein [Candidatus Limnocylindrales bacterium]